MHLVPFYPHFFIFRLISPSVGRKIEFLKSGIFFFDFIKEFLFFRFSVFELIFGKLGPFSALGAHFGRAPNITFGAVLEPRSKKWPNFTYSGGGYQAFEKWEFVFGPPKLQTLRKN